MSRTSNARPDNQAWILSDSRQRALLAKAAPSCRFRLSKQRLGSTPRAAALSESAASNVTAERRSAAGSTARPFRSPVSALPDPTRGQDPLGAQLNPTLPCPAPSGRHPPRRCGWRGGRSHLPAARRGAGGDPVRTGLRWVGGEKGRGRRAAGPEPCSCVGACRSRGRGRCLLLYFLFISLFFIYFFILNSG